MSTATPRRAARQGDELLFLGPRRSLPLADVDGSAVLAGDETSIAAARTLRLRSAGEVRFVCEATDPTALQPGLVSLGLADLTSVVARRDDDAHVPELVAAVDHAVSSIGARRVFFTGRAHAIQALKRQGRATSSTIQARP